MNKKITFFILIAAAWVVFLPGQSFASSTDNKTGTISELVSGSPVLEQNRGRGRGRGMYNRRYNRRVIRNNRRSRVVRQVYYRNGRRYVRTVRVY